MKQLKTLLLAITLCIGAFSFTQAQSKVAHINTQELIVAMPEYKAAQTEIETLSKTYDTEFKGIAAEYQNTYKQYEAEAPTKTDEENQKRGVALQEKQQRIQQFQTDAAKDLQDKQAALMVPITEKAKAAILKVSRAQGFQYVLDSSPGGGVIMADGKNLLDDVKKELGI